MRKWMFFSLLLTGVGALLTLLFALGYVGPQGPSFTHSVKGMGPGTAELVRGVWVARQPDGSFRVFANRDPHCGNATKWHQDQQRFITPQHGEVYSIAGECQGGPCGPAGLYQVRFEVANDALGILEIFPGEIIGGGFPK